MKKLIIDIRNKTAFVFSWLVIFWMVLYPMQNQYSTHHRSEILIAELWQLLILALLGVVLHSLFFNSRFFKKTSFELRFTYFLASCAFVESLLIYQFQLFGISKLDEWGWFYLIMLAFYLISMGIFQIYKKESGKHYTELLKQYQKKNEGKLHE